MHICAVRSDIIDFASSLHNIIHICRTNKTVESLLYMFMKWIVLAATNRIGFVAIWPSCGVV